LCASLSLRGEDYTLQKAARRVNFLIEDEVSIRGELATAQNFAQVQLLPAPPGELVFETVCLRLLSIVPADAERGLSPYYHFGIFTDAAEVGHINFRVGASDHVRLYSGHIGYEVTEPFRGNRYGLRACRALAPFMRSIYSSVILTSDPDNWPSLRTIERLGAVFLEVVAVPPEDPNYQRGSRSKRRYLWSL